MEEGQSLMMMKGKMKKVKNYDSAERKSQPNPNPLNGMTH